MSKYVFPLAFAWVFLTATATAFAGVWDEPSWQFYLAPGAAPSGWTKVSPDTAYDNARGYGYESTTGISQNEIAFGGIGYTTADRPFYFSVGLPEGNYRVAVTLGGGDEYLASNTTIKAEVRRLMIENADSGNGKTVRREFVVSIRRPQIAGAIAGSSERASVNLKPRELAEEKWSWDEKLTLEFNSTPPARPAVAAIEITRAEEVPTLFLLGDSTVCDQPREPYASWGQMITRFFKPSIAVSSHAESGESYASSIKALRFAKVLSQIRPGDTVMLQFGHNDMKVVDVPAYKESIKAAVRLFRAKKASVILVTPPHRRTFDANGKITNSHKGYPDAVREAAREENAPLIDLLAMTQQFYEAMGKEKSAAAFKPGDGTHHNNYGAYELAKCVVEGIRSQKLPLARHIADDFVPFDPSKPDAPDSLQIPASLTAPGEKPDGS